MGVEELPAQEAIAPWRLRLGGSIFVVGFATPVLVPLVARSDLPGGWKATLTGLLVAGIPEAFSLVAVAILGKAGYRYFKGRLLRLLKRYGPPQQVSRVRYRVGLVMFVIPLLAGWSGPYLAYLVPGLDATNVVAAIALDGMWIASLFVLGGEFWDKIQALFVHEAKAQPIVSED